jgi:hypothetical protein
MSAKHGIEETKEVIKLGFVLTALIAKEIKDGFQIGDLLSVFNKIQSDEAKKEVIVQALKDIKKVPEEIKDINLTESIELAIFAGKEVPVLLEALKA